MYEYLHLYFGWPYKQLKIGKMCYSQIVSLTLIKQYIMPVLLVVPKHSSIQNLHQIHHIIIAIYQLIFCLNKHCWHCFPASDSVTVSLSLASM